MAFLFDEKKQSGSAENYGSLFFKNLSKEEMESLYAHGYSFYQMDKLEKARPFFAVLTMLNPFVKKYWMGLAAIDQKLKDNHKALESFAKAALIDYDDPYPHFHAGECYLVEGDLAEAAKAFDLAEECASKGKYFNGTLIERIQEIRSEWLTDQEENSPWYQG